MALNVPDPEFGEDRDSEHCGLEGGIMGEFGKMLIVIGGILLLVGLLLTGLGRVHLAPGHLPGDIRYQGKHFTFYFPLTTCLLLSILASAIFHLINHLRR